MIEIDSAISGATTILLNNRWVYPSEKRNIGRVVNIFGPVSEPYIAIAPNKGMRITKIVGREVYRK